MTIKICKECNKIAPAGHKFCRKCGKPLSTAEPPKERDRYSTMAIYGPPYRAKWLCPKCGWNEIDSGLGSPAETNYCPMCGEKISGPASVGRY